MTLTGFKAANHPQQTEKRGALDEIDDRGTKWEFIRELEARPGWGPFTLDVAAAPHNAKAPRFYTRLDDGLARPWTGNVWCNPPFSRHRGVMDLGSWVSKAWAEWSAVHAVRIVMLVPANRTEQLWWQEHVEHRRDRPDSPLRVEFLHGRMRFDMPPGWTKPEKGDRPPFGCALLIWGPR